MGHAGGKLCVAVSSISPQLKDSCPLIWSHFPVARAQHTAQVPEGCSPWLPRAPPVSFLGTPLFHGTRVLPIGFPTPNTKDFFLPWPSTAAKGRGFLPGQCLGWEKYRSCFCSGHDLGEKEKEVHQGKTGSLSSLFLASTQAFPIFTTKANSPIMLQGLSSSILSLFFLSMAVFLKELLDPRFCFLLTPSICFSSQPAFLETKMSEALQVERNTDALLGEEPGIIKLRLCRREKSSFTSACLDPCESLKRSRDLSWQRRGRWGSPWLTVPCCIKAGEGQLSFLTSSQIQWAPSGFLWSVELLYCQTLLSLISIQDPLGLSFFCICFALKPSRAITHSSLVNPVHSRFFPIHICAGGAQVVSPAQISPLSSRFLWAAPPGTSDSTH